MKSVDRIYLQYSLNDAAIHHVLDWQQKVVHRNPSARPVPKEQLHLTVIHFGVATEVYAEIKQQQPRLNWGQFETAAADFLSTTNTILPPAASGRPTGITHMGAHGSTAVISIDPSEELNRAHAQSLEALSSFFRACEISFPRAFMQGSQNFRYALEFRPHITLSRSAPTIPNIDIQNVGPFKFKAMKTLYSHT